jgi:predicted RNA binding protein YcfA (HicA-like mRNA interferase family)
MASAAKELKEVIKEAKRQGWRVTTTKRGHLQFYAPDGENIVTAAGTPSDHRALANLIARLRRHGFVWKGR